MKTRLNIELPVDMVSQLKKMAMEQDRSLTNMVTRICKTAISGPEVIPPLTRGVETEAKPVILRDYMAKKMEGMDVVEAATFQTYVMGQMDDIRTEMFGDVIEDNDVD